MKKKIVIDCDTGVDDAVAILLACDCPDADILAITCVRGNCSLDQAVRNTCIALKVAGKQVSKDCTDKIYCAIFGVYASQHNFFHVYDFGAFVIRLEYVLKKAFC